MDSRLKKRSNNVQTKLLHYAVLLILQDVIERSIIDLFTEREVVEPGSYLHEFPYPLLHERSVSTTEYFYRPRT